MSKAYISKEVIAAVLARSGGQCEICSRTYQMEMAHIEAKGMGGIGHKERAERIDHENNIAHLCVFCHWWMSHAVRVIVSGAHSYFNDPKLPRYEAKAREMGIWRRNEQDIDDIRPDHGTTSGTSGSITVGPAQPDEECFDLW